jgi:hypothetical protein
MMNGTTASSMHTLLAQRLAALDLCQMTPLQALTFLHTLQQEVKEAVSLGRMVL